MVKPRRKKNESDAAYNERASKLYYHEGYHIKEIAERLNIDQIKVYNYVARGKKITTEEERQAIIYLYNKGYSYSAIAKIMGKSRSCVTDRIKNPAKVKWQDSPDNLSDKQIKKIKDMAENGEHIIDIAKEMGIKSGSVKHRLRHIGIKEKYTHVSDNEIKTFIRLYKKGMPILQIAKACNRSRGTVSTYLHKAGYWKHKNKQ